MNGVEVVIVLVIVIVRTLALWRRCGRRMRMPVKCVVYFYDHSFVEFGLVEASIAARFSRVMKMRETEDLHRHHRRVERYGLSIACIVGWFALCERAGGADEVTCWEKAMSEDVYRIL
jgi:hypothetical protein